MTLRQFNDEAIYGSNSLEAINNREQLNVKLKCMKWIVFMIICLLMATFCCILFLRDRSDDDFQDWSMYIKEYIVMYILLAFILFICSIGLIQRMNQTIATTDKHGRSLQPEKQRIKHVAIAFTIAFIVRALAYLVAGFVLVYYDSKAFDNPFVQELVDFVDLLITEVIPFTMIYHMHYLNFGKNLQPQQNQGYIQRRGTSGLESNLNDSNIDTNQILEDETVYNLDEEETLQKDLTLNDISMIYEGSGLVNSRIMRRFMFAQLEQEAKAKKHHSHSESERNNSKYFQDSISQNITTACGGGSGDINNYCNNQNTKSTNLVLLDNIDRLENDLIQETRVQSYKKQAKLSRNRMSMPVLPI